METSINGKLLEMFRKATHWMHRHSHHGRRDRSRPMMPPAQGRLLHLLAEKGPVTQRSLSEELNLRSASLSELLIKLERHGLISRQPNEAYKRTVDIVLTKEGNEMKDAIMTDHHEAADDIFSALSAEEAGQLYSLMGKLLDSWESKFGREALGSSHGFGHHQGPHGGRRHPLGGGGEEEGRDPRHGRGPRGRGHDENGGRHLWGGPAESRGLRGRGHAEDRGHDNNESEPETVIPSAIMMAAVEIADSAEKLKIVEIKKPRK